MLFSVQGGTVVFSVQGRCCAILCSGEVLLYSVQERCYCILCSGEVLLYSLFRGGAIVFSGLGFYCCVLL